ncbi:pentapeptide repeat-containing protein [Nonomuraea antimicrobica]|uniref:pentapeptide repeat-containing protein n=1 Tax=Nonomuraea antimicrobica TaxID=561173 RepID=UPI0031EE12CF
MVAIAACAGAAAALPMPDWARWTLTGTALTGVACLLLALLIGPVARRLAGESTPLSTAERRQMSPAERVEAVNAARHTLIQAATGIVVIGGLVFTAQGLWYTAESLNTAREAQLLAVDGQRLAEQGQITDRYTKAVEQLGSAKQDVRLGGIYALQRLAVDSPRDRDSIRNVLAAFVRRNDFCTATDEQPKLPTICTAKTATHEKLQEVRLTKPKADVSAAMTIAANLASSGRGDGTTPFGGLADFSQVRFHRAELTEMSLRNVDLNTAFLGGAQLYGADLRGADLRFAFLGSANLDEAHLDGAYLAAASLSGANLQGANLRGAFLQSADLSGADLRGADLSGADLRGADLSGADLEGVKGKTSQQIRAEAIVDETTRF